MKLLCEQWAAQAEPLVPHRGMPLAIPVVTSGWFFEFVAVLATLQFLHIGGELGSGLAVH